MTRPCWLRRAVKPHRHAIEQASRRWRRPGRYASANWLVWNRTDPSPTNFMPRLPSAEHLSVNRRTASARSSLPRSRRARRNAAIYDGCAAGKESTSSPRRASHRLVVYKTLGISKHATTVVRQHDLSHCSDRASRAAHTSRSTIRTKQRACATTTPIRPWRDHARPAFHHIP